MSNIKCNSLTKNQFPNENLIANIKLDEDEIILQKWKVNLIFILKLILLIIQIFNIQYVR